MVQALHQVLLLLLQDVNRPPPTQQQQLLLLTIRDQVGFSRDEKEGIVCHAYLSMP
jgi:hypothetical protein